MNCFLFSHHLLAAFRTVYLIAGNACLVGGRCSTLWADTFTARACTCTVAAHLSATAATPAHASSSSRTSSLRSCSIFLWHRFHLPYTISYKEIACSGHSSTQVPQSTHVSALTCAVSFTVIASTGHISAQVPQPVHFAISMVIAISVVLSS